MAVTRYPGMLDTIEGEFNKERNETYQVFQFLSRKQCIGESLVGLQQDARLEHLSQGY